MLGVILFHKYACRFEPKIDLSLIQSTSSMSVEKDTTAVHPILLKCNKLHPPTSTDFQVYYSVTLNFVYEHTAAEHNRKFASIVILLLHEFDIF